MKKIVWIIVLFGVIVLSGCKDTNTDPVCTEEETLVGGVCVDKIVTCDPGYILEGEECVVEDTRTDLERAFEQSIGMDNYQLDIQLNEGATTVNMILEFDENLSTFTVNDKTEYYVNEDGVCLKYSIQLGEVVEETIDCIASEDTRFKFFHGFEVEWFEEIEDGYALKEGNYALLTNFFRNAQPDAVVSDFVMTLENEYFHTFTFAVTSNEMVYHFMMTFSNVDEVMITLPE